MQKTLVAADASLLIGLATAGAFDLLRRLFGTVMITRIVKDEVMAGSGRPGATELDAAMRSGWIRVAPAPPETWTFTDLDVGEASTIALALRHRGPAAVLMDDALGRERAAALGLEVTGLAEVLVAAKGRGLVRGIRPFLERLARRGFVLPREAVRAALVEAGEEREEDRGEDRG